MGAPELAKKIEGKEAVLAHYKAELDKLYPDVARDIKAQIDKRTREAKKQLLAGEAVRIDHLVKLQNQMIIDMYRMWAFSPEITELKEKALDEFGVGSDESDEINREIVNKDSELRFYLVEKLDELEQLVNNR